MLLVLCFSDSREEGHKKGGDRVLCVSMGILGNIEEHGIDGRHITEGIKGLHEIPPRAPQKIPGVGTFL